ncbi:MAG: hypothetical protein H7329_12140 [Opitutaceae bacterium]|nr:hypothetical protein [Cytophagales bacterium]
MRIKPFGLIIAALIVGILLYWVIKPKYSSTPTNVPESPSMPSANSNKSNDWNDESTKKTSNDEKTSSTQQESRAFDYSPEKPENGTLKGVVELGAAGFNSFVINLDKKKRWEIVSKDFGQSLAYEGLATTEDIRAGLKKYIASMLDKGVNKNDIHFVISSGAQKEPKTETISNELKKMGYIVNKVTPEQEGQLALKAVLPPSFADNSYVIDIGSGNTKVSWDENGSLKTIELPGAKYFEKEMSDADAYSQVKSQVNKIPEGKRNVAFIIGGVPFSLAKQTRKGEERYTVLNAPDFYKASDKKMTSGLNIYKGFVDGTKTDTFVFDWDANFTIGFLLQLNK